MDRDTRMSDVEVIGRFVMRLTFTDGAVREVDLSPLAKDRPRWKEPGFFDRLELHRDSDTIVWPDGDHLHGEMLYAWSLGPSKAG